ncbi:MAG: DDE-type integrase/transposase/recombinase [Nitrospira sp.]|nr:DDE-type integrase/transposase/recombinase [Nitrospira sp.]
MSHTTSASTNRPYGVVRVCQERGVRRSTFYHQQGRGAPSQGAPAKRGPKTAYTDEGLTTHIRQVLAASPFLGEGHRKVWARLRAQGIRTSKRRVLRLMRQADLLAPSRAPRVVGPRVHDGTITTERPNQMWGTDATSTVTVEDGVVTVFVAIDHCTLEGIGIHAARRATRFEALEPIRQGVRLQFGTVSAGIAMGLQVRHDHGSQYMSEEFQAQLRFLGIMSSPAFVRAPEGNGVAERFIRTLKEQLLWVQTFRTVEELRLALLDWLRLYNEQWLIERHGFRSPSQVRRDLLVTLEAA